MKRNQAFWFTSIIFCFVLGFGMTSSALAENIRIGVASPFTGDLAAYGDNIKAGVSLKLKEINDAGGINGKFYFTVAVKGDWLKSRMREIFTSGCVSSEGWRVQWELVPPR